MATAQQSELTLTDILSRLDYPGARKLLGADGVELLSAGGKFEIDVTRQVRLTERALSLSFAAPDNARVEIALARRAKRSLRLHCSACDGVCVHLGAALSIVLEEKVALGLAIAPQAGDVEPLDDEQLIARELEAREQRSREEKMVIRASQPATPWCDYQVSSKLSGKTWRVALRGMQRGQSYCSCPDFRKNTLGTCKHILNVQRKVSRKFSEKRLARGFKLRTVIVYLEYAQALSLRVAAPDKLAARSALKPFLNGPVEDCQKLVRAIAKTEAGGTSVTVYPDAEEYIQRQLSAQRIGREIAAIRSRGADHPLRRELLKTELLPYQLEGVLFAAEAGRAILADDMGLGKTIQGVGTAELLARLAGIGSVLVICPASLKGQWRSEIARFCDRECQIVVGGAASRAEQYASDAFFTICNYEQVLRDVLPIERQHWDLIILDEGQRIKNWQAKTSQVIKSLRSTFALVLSGTPIENRLDELYSVIEFIDDRRLGPGFRFYHHHRVVDERGKVLGYRNLAQLREMLKPVLLRRTRASVLKELPPRQTEIIRIAPTQEQEEMHGAHMRTVSSIVNKPFISEMDLLRLQKALLMCRMSADSTQLVDKQTPGYSSKLQECDELLVRLAAEDDRKSVLFSEWTSMLDLIQAQLEQHDIGFARLDGSVPQQKRAALVAQFKDDPDCRFFLATNAGSTGLNLQFANTLINIDLPWNPAVLEQRIGRVHRMGQQRPVQVYVLVTTGTIEENLLATLAAKHELANAALDASSDIDQVDLVSNMEALKRRLEILLGAVPEAGVDESQKAQTEREAAEIQRREQVALAGGQLLGAAFDFIGQLLPQAPSNPQTAQLARQLSRQFEQCTETDEQGRPRLTVTLPDKASLDGLADSIARLMATADNRR